MAIRKRAVSYLSDKAMKGMRKRSKQVAAALVAAKATANKYASRGTQTRTQTCERSSKACPTVVHGKAVKSKKRKVKKTTSDLKGVSKALAKKVNKVIQYTGVWGIYSYNSDVQLRQWIRDQWSYYVEDNNAWPFDFFTPRDIWDAASICFHGKAAAYNGSLSNTNSFSPALKLQVLNSYATFYFKSTSTHVVNIEMIIMSPKKMEPEQDPYQAIYQSTDDFHNPGTSVLPTIPSFKLGWCPTLLQLYNVETRTIKMLPGESASEFLQGPKNITIDGSYHLIETGSTTDINSFNRYAKFSKTVIFRVINDISVSTASTIVGAFPSSTIGGVALRMERVIRVNDPKVPGTLNAGKNAIAAGMFYRNAEGAADQQVCVNNPINVASFGG